MADHAVGAGRRVEGRDEPPAQYPAKRALDVVLGVFGLLLATPLIAVVALAIWYDSGGPVVYRTQRFGRGGRLFRMYKFRTMIPRAAERLEELGHLNLGQGMVKIPGDPRVTRIGRICRRFSLDELLQLWNVIRGDMSLVGPRPHDPSEISLEDEMHRFRLSVRPGLTGLWQVSARSDPSLNVRVRYDLQYIRECDFVLDVKILCRTLMSVVRGDGDRVQVGEPAVVLSTESPQTSAGEAEIPSPVFAVPPMAIEGAELA